MSLGSIILPALIDCGGRRCGIDQRHFIYTDHIPSRRSDSDRRSGLERRNGGQDRRSNNDRRNGQKVIEIKNRREDSGRRDGSERRMAFAVAMR